MSAPLASAPGKILVAGEYAVLAGHEAVLVAVDRRAVAYRAGAGAEASPFLDAARRLAAAELGAEPPPVAVDSSALREGDRKLGLGSSAAATVAAVAAAGVRDRARIHALAHRAHGDAQAARGARGSGADIAASTWGGVIAVRAAADPLAPCAVRPLAWPASLSWVAAWTGAPADTATLVAAVARFAARDPAGHAARLSDLAAAAADFAAALTPGRPDAGAAVAAAHLGSRAAAALGQAAGVAIETPIHRRIADLAAQCGGAAKPTGAGGGDIAVALFADPDAAAAFARAAAAEGISLPALALETSGVRSGA